MPFMTNSLPPFFFDDRNSTWGSRTFPSIAKNCYDTPSKMEMDIICEKKQEEKKNENKIHIIHLYDRKKNR